MEADCKIDIIKHTCIVVLILASQEAEPVVSAYMLLLYSGVQSQGSRRKRNWGEAEKEEEQTGGWKTDRTTAWFHSDLCLIMQDCLLRGYVENCLSKKSLQEEKGRRTGLSAIDKGSLPGEFTSQLFLVAWCFVPLATAERPEYHVWQGAIGSCSHEAVDTMGKSRACAKLVAVVAPGVKPEVKDLRNKRGRR